MPDVPMKSPITTFLYVLMRDHLPTGTVKYLIDQAQRAGDPAYSAPELEQLAERYAAELLGAPPRKTGEKSTELEDRKNGSGDPPEATAAADAELQHELDAERKPPPAPDPVPPAESERPGANEKLASQEYLDRVLAWINRQGTRPIRPGEIDEGVGISKVTRSRCITQLEREGKIRAEGSRASRRVFALVEADTTSGGDAEDANRVSGAGGSSPAGTGAEPVDDDEAGESPASTSESSAGDRGEPRPGEPGPPDEGAVEDAAAEPDPGGASEDVAEQLEANALDNMGDLDGAAGETRTEPPPGKPSDSGGNSVLEAAGRFIDEADGEVWPHELETALGIGQHMRLTVVEKLKEEKRITIIAPRSPRVRYRSTKQRRPASPSRSGGGGEAAEPLGSGPLHLSDASRERADEATAERKADEAAAAEALPKVREWVRRGSGTFGARQVRDLFELTPGACTRVIGALTQEGAIRRAGDSRADTYEAATSNGNGNGAGNRAGKRPLHAGADGSTLEGRALSAMTGDGLSVKAVMARLGISEDVARSLVGKMYREGDVRPRKKHGETVYVAVV